MIVDDYWEIGASGRRYDRDFVLEVLEERHREPHPDEWAIAGFRGQATRPNGVPGDLHLVAGPVGRRAERRCGRTSTGRWRAVYHQGTIVGAAAELIMTEATKGPVARVGRLVS